jgi:hypothetical protein
LACSTHAGPPGQRSNIEGFRVNFSKVRSIARGFSFPSWSVPIALLVLVVLSYGLRALSLGFYWDDWPSLWFFHRFGAPGIIAAYTQDRPFLSFIYTITLTLLGNSSQAWQLFALFARWLCSLGLWWSLELAWPRQANKSVWAVFLFTVYPGFTQQWIAIIYGQAFLLYALVFLSIALTLWLARRRQTLPKWVIALGLLLALAASAFTMFSTEYFFGVELLRPILLWFVLAPASDSSSPRKPWLRRVLQTLSWWGPNLLLMLFFVVYRGFLQIFPSATFTTLQGLSQSPLHELQNLVLTITEDLIESSLVAWGQTLQLGGFLDAGISAGLRLLGIILVGAILSTLYLGWLRPRSSLPESEKGSDENWAGQAILVGGMIALASGWPFWITGLPMRMGFPQDRYSLPLAPGICLLLAGLVDLLGGKVKGNSELWRKAGVIGLAIGLAAGFHSSQALLYRQEWNRERDFFWQLTWRAPAIQPGTLFLTSNTSFLYNEDDSLSAPLNWTYDPDSKTKEMKYILYDVLVRQHSLTDLSPGQKVVKDFRATIFQGSTSQALVIHYGASGCVHVLDPVYDADLYQLPERLQTILPLSNPRKWITDAGQTAAPPSTVFGSEPKHRWCYYYEQAELARQKEDWEAIPRIQHESIHAGMRPEDPAEYLPFIEGYLRLARVDDAINLSLSTYAESRALRPAICAVWTRALQSGIKPSNRKLGILNNNLHCSFP